MLHRLATARGAALISGLGVALIAGAATAAENAAGIYLLGFRGPLAGVTPPPGIYVENDSTSMTAASGAGAGCSSAEPLPPMSTARRSSTPRR